MTVFIWDASHFDGALNIADMRQAYNQGIRVFTHKLGEGVSNVDTTATAALVAARDAGIPVLGGYWFNHGEDDPVAEADRMIARADAVVPWWRSFPYWIWQPDCEPETGHTRPSPAWVKANADRLKAKTGRPAVLYAPHWSYGSSLADVAKTYPLWDSQYGSNPADHFDRIYPGDKSVRWGPWPGYPSPMFLQYGSKATIAGHTTCDVSAFRGSLDQLLTRLNQLMGVNDVELTDKTPAGRTVGAALDLAADPFGQKPWGSGYTAAVALQGAYTAGQSAATKAAVEALSAKLDALTVQVAALSTAGIDYAALAKAVNDDAAQRLAN